MEPNTKNILQILEHCREACMDFIAEHQNASDGAILKCISFCKDCEKICETTAYYIERRSFYSKRLLKLCSEICHKCADELLKNQFTDGKKCAEICRNCAQECATAS